MSPHSEVMNIRVPSGTREKFRRLALLSQVHGKTASQGEFFAQLLREYEETHLLQDTSFGLRQAVDEDPAGDAYAAL